jgi:hypothetical protein
MNSAAPGMPMREYRAALRADFHIFVVRCFMELNSAASFQRMFPLFGEHGPEVTG